MRQSNRLSAIVLVALMLGVTLGCGGAARLSPAHKEIIELKNKADLAMDRDNFERAVKLYEGSLALSRSIEDFDYIAMNLLHLASAYRQMGDVDAAGAALSQILNDEIMQYPPRRLANANLMMSLLAVDAGELKEAGEFAAKALDLCRASKCPQLGAANNMLGRIAYLEGDNALAAQYAEEGQKNSKKGSADWADSRRISADAMMGQGRHAEASELYAEALSADKRLGLGRRVALDLLGLGSAAQKAGQKDKALKYFRRAAVAARNTGDSALVEKAEWGLGFADNP